LGVDEEFVLLMFEGEFDVEGALLDDIVDLALHSGDDK
jgi:hypothetical protein